MFVIGAVTTIDGVVACFDDREDKALSSDAALHATVEVVSALDKLQALTVWLDRRAGR